MGLFLIGTQQLGHFYLIVVAHLPKENEQLLMKMHLFGGIRQICLHQRVIQQPRHATQYKVKVFVSVYP